MCHDSLQAVVVDAEPHVLYLGVSPGPRYVEEEDGEKLPYTSCCIVAAAVASKGAHSDVEVTVSSDFIESQLLVLLRLSPNDALSILNEKK